MTGPIVLALRLLLTLALYAFLGWALWTIWQDLRRTAAQASPGRIPAIRIEVRKRNQTAAPRIFSQPEVTVGRDPACDIRLDEDTVSARHAKISFHHGQWWIEDLKSTNGTKLNKLRLTTATVLTGGDEINCGKARLLVDLGSKLPAE
jgi:pSer/pThr/pTyr-binding forkhead associated (FHA) protein